MTLFVHLNGRLLPEPQARVSPLDRGFLLGDGVFETLRLDDGAPRHLVEHLARLARSASLTGIPLPEADYGSIVREVARANAFDRGAAMARITLTRGPGGRGTNPRGAGPPTLLVTVAPSPYGPDLYERGADAIVAARRHVPPTAMDPRVKGTSYLPLVLARAEAETAGAFEALLLDAAGARLVEATSANVFLVKDGALATPDLASGCLDGITRAEVIALARGEGFPVEERPVSPGELRTADEVFLTASVLGVLGLVRIDNENVGAGRPGEWTRRLSALLPRGPRAP